eukprot:5939510-Ditylum_brightwellii.AAC.1
MSKLILEGDYEMHEWKEKIRVWNGCTTTSPSRPHLGHLKALQSKGPYAPTSEDSKALYKKQQALIQAQ